MFRNHISNTNSLSSLHLYTSYHLPSAGGASSSLESSNHRFRATVLQDLFASINMCQIEADLYHACKHLEIMYRPCVLRTQTQRICFPLNYPALHAFVSFCPACVACGQKLAMEDACILPMHANCKEDHGDFNGVDLESTKYDDALPKDTNYQTLGPWKGCWYTKYAIFFEACGHKDVVTLRSLLPPSNFAVGRFRRYWVSWCQCAIGRMTKPLLTYFEARHKCFACYKIARSR